MDSREAHKKLLNLALHWLHWLRQCKQSTEFRTDRLSDGLFLYFANYAIFSNLARLFVPVVDSGIEMG